MRLVKDWKRTYLIMWTVFLFAQLVFHLAVPAHAVGPCGWTNGPAEWQAVNLTLGVAGVAGIVGIFIPPIGIAALVLGGIGSAYGAVLTMSQC